MILHFFLFLFSLTLPGHIWNGKKYTSSIFLISSIFNFFFSFIRSFIPFLLIDCIFIHFWTQRKNRKKIKKINDSWKKKKKNMAIEEKGGSNITATVTFIPNSKYICAGNNWGEISVWAQFQVFFLSLSFFLSFFKKTKLVLISLRFMNQSNKSIFYLLIFYYSLILKNSSTNP